MHLNQDLLARLEAPMSAVASQPLDDPAAAAAALERAFPADGAHARSLRDALLAAADAGRILERGDDVLRFSRLAKSDATVHDVSVDVVSMSAGGPRHRHPRGEANLCWALEGSPRFDGQAPGWIVFPPGSAHVPTVSGGRMLIAYFLPGGAMEWLKD